VTTSSGSLRASAIFSFTLLLPRTLDVWPTLDKHPVAGQNSNQKSRIPTRRNWARAVRDVYACQFWWSGNSIDENVSIDGSIQVGAGPSAADVASLIEVVPSHQRSATAADPC
jgi:hypothetical protein